MKKETLVISASAMVAMSFAVCVSVLSNSQSTDDSFTMENIEALSYGEDNKYSIANQVIASVKEREGSCYICKVQYTYKLNGKEYRHFENIKTSNTWKKCSTLIIPKDDPRVNDNCQYKLCPGAQSEAPIEEDWPM